MTRIKPGHAIIFWGGFLGGGVLSTPESGFLPIPILRDGRRFPAPIEALPRQIWNELDHLSPELVLKRPLLAPVPKIGLVSFNQ